MACPPAIFGFDAIVGRNETIFEVQFRTCARNHWDIEMDLFPSIVVDDFETPILMIRIGFGCPSEEAMDKQRVICKFILHI